MFLALLIIQSAAEPLRFCIPAPHESLIQSVPSCGVGSNVRPPAGGETSCDVPTPPYAPPQFLNSGGSRPVGLPFATRSPVYARHGMAATSQPLSTNVALDVLKAGGSAVDAAIAANAMEGVVEPMMNGMGGDLMAIVWDEESQSLHGLNSCGRAPVEGTSLADLRKLIDQATPGKTTIPSKGPLGVTVPGAVKGWCMLHERFGKLPWSKLFEGPIATAREGFPVTPVIASEWEVTDPTSPEVTSGGASQTRQTASPPHS